MKTHLLTFFPGDDEEILKTLRTVAKDFRGKVSFADKAWRKEKNGRERKNGLLLHEVWDINF